MNNRLIRITAFALIFVFLFAGPGYAGDDTSRKSPSVNVGVQSLPASLDPFKWQGDISECCMDLIFQPLMQRDKTSGELILILANRVEQLDSRNYIVYIYDNITDQAGVQISSSDVAYSYMRCKSSGAFPNLAFVEQINIIDGHSLRVVMNTDSYYQFGAAMSQIHVVSIKTYLSDEITDKTLSGTGPYRLVSFDSGNRLELESRDDYWGSDLASPLKTSGWIWHAQNADRICYQAIRQSQIMKIALDTGAIDIAENINAENAAFFADDPDYTVWELSSTDTYTLQFNQSEAYSPCSDINLRRAICYAIDAEAIIELLGGEKLLCTTWGACTLSDYLHKWDSGNYYLYDPDLSSDYLSQSGYDTSLPLKLMCEDTEEAAYIAQLIQRCLLAAGIETELSIYDNHKFNVNSSNASMWDIRLQPVDAECIPDFSVEAFSGAFYANGLNSCFFADEELDRLIESASVINGYQRDRLEAVCSYITSEGRIPEPCADDDTLTELLAALSVGSGHSITSLTALQDYIYENCYGYALFSNICYNVTRAGIETFPVNVQLCVFPNACAYTDDYFSD